MIASFGDAAAIAGSSAAKAADRPQGLGPSGAARPAPRRSARPEAEYWPGLACPGSGNRAASPPAATPPLPPAPQQSDHPGHPAGSCQSEAAAGRRRPARPRDNPALGPRHDCPAAPGIRQKGCPQAPAAAAPRAGKSRRLRPPPAPALGRRPVAAALEPWWIYQRPPAH